MLVIEVAAGILLAMFIKAVVCAWLDGEFDSKRSS